MTQTILVVDDKKELLIMVKLYLTQEGFRVVTAMDGQEALYVARYERPDLILLDLMMPRMGGYEFLRAYTREAETPIVILTAKLEENDKVLGLELGADDYVTKPFSMRELTARIRAVLRRAGKKPLEPDLLRVGEIVLDRIGRTVTVRGKRVHLTPSEFALLAVLMSAPGRVFSRSELLERVGDVASESYERSVDVHIRNLRLKIEPEPRHPRTIATVYGAGYRFAADPRSESEKRGR
jgi:DNA-binding response OmpR family regulator